MVTNKADSFSVTFQTGRPIILRSPGASAEMSGTLIQVFEKSITARLTSPKDQVPSTGEKILAEYWDSTAVYFFFVKVLQVLSGSEVVLSRPAKGIQFQRRKSARVEAMIPLHGLVASAARDELVGEVLRDLKTKDISPQGLRFETDLPLEIGDTLLLWLDLSEKHSVKVHAWVVWSEPTQRRGKTSHSIGLSFLQVGPEEQMQLMQFLGRYQTSDRREFARWETSIPCKVTWGRNQIEGEIVNLSLDGALVTGVHSFPPKKETVMLTISVGDEEVVVASRVTARVIHTGLEMTEARRETWGLFGMEFMESGEELRAKLTPVLRYLFSKERAIGAFGE